MKCVSPLTVRHKADADATSTMANNPIHNSRDQTGKQCVNKMSMLMEFLMLFYQNAQIQKQRQHIYNTIAPLHLSSSFTSLTI